MSPNAKEASYRGDVVLTVEECRQVIKRKLRTDDVEVLRVETSTHGDSPAGFMGDHYLVTITAVSKENGAEPTVLKLFMKTLPKNPLHYDFVVKTDVFQKEIWVFSTLIHDLMKHNGSLELNADVQPEWAGECYLSTPTKLVFEDLTVKGFVSRDHLIPMDYDHCVVVLQTLARIHASSIIFEEKETERTGVVCRIIDLYPPEKFAESIWVGREGHPCQEMYQTGVNCVCALLKYLPSMREDEGRYQEVVKRLSACYRDMPRRSRASTEFRNVFSHGDVWSNNLLFRYGASNKPIDVKFVDYQLIRYTSPAHDIMCFLYFTTRRQMRDKHFLDLALVYHVALKHELARHQLDVAVILPWEELKKSLEAYREVGSFNCCVEFPIINMSDSVLAEIMPSPEKFHKFFFKDRISEASHCFETNPVFRELLTECMEELIELLERRQML